MGHQQHSGARLRVSQPGSAVPLQAVAGDTAGAGSEGTLLLSLCPEAGALRGTKQHPVGWQQAGPWPRSDQMVVDTMAPMMQMVMTNRMRTRSTEQMMFSALARAPCCRAPSTSPSTLQSRALME